MRPLKIYLIALILTLAFFFNIERLDVGEENLLNIQTFVYVLVVLIIVPVLLMPLFSRYRVTVTVTFSLGIYIICKWFFWSGQDSSEGVFIYVIITEVAFILGTAFLSQRLSRSLFGMQDGFEALILYYDEEHLQPVSDATSEIRREITRSRHYHRPLSLIVVEPNQQSLDTALPEILIDLQQSMLNRFARARLAKTMSKHLRLMDLILEENDKQFIILCPELDDQGSAEIIERIETVMGQENIAVECTSVTFPEEGLTFEGLLDKAKGKLLNDSMKKM